MKNISLLIVVITIAFNLWLYYPETQIMADPNDNAFQYSLVNRTNWVWETYGCPFSLSCLPSLLDHNVPNWAEGYPLPFYYSHLPQIAIVASYNLIIDPLSSLFSFTLYQYYNWTKYLLLCFFPLPVFLALRVSGFSSVLAALGALFAAHFSTDGLYGIDPPSFLWRGYGLTSQLYAMMFLPLGIAYTYRALLEKSNVKSKNWIIGNLLKAILFLTLTTAGHLGLGIMGLLSAVPFLLIDSKPKNIIRRMKILAVIGSCVIFLLSYWIIPILLENDYHIISFWDPIWKFDSYGWYEIIRQAWQGELFDWGRPPIVSFLVFVGFFSALLGSRFPYALLFLFWFLLYFGRTTWGGLIDLIPGMKDFHQHRFIVGIHMAGIFLIPVALEHIQSLIKQSHTWIHVISSKFKAQNSKILGKIQNWKLHSGIIGIYWIILAVLLYFTIHQTFQYNALNSRWIYEANAAYRHDEAHFNDLLTRLRNLPNARIYAGRPGNWGKQLRLGSSELYMLVGTYGYDMSQFLPETWSPLSENEQDFDERVPEDYDLLNIRYVVADQSHGFPDTVRLLETYGPFQLYEAETGGWFDVVSSPMLVSSEKTNFINVVHYWHRSFPRRWNMHPIITVESPKAPHPLQKTIRMTDEVSYHDTSDQSQKTSHQPQNIFADYPFVFPEATVSGNIVRESVDKQSYTATIDVPDPCPSCMIMFKMSYHPNWKVTVDGRPAEKYAVFPFYLATPASPGTHIVEWTYKPNGLKIFLLGMEMIGIVAFVYWIVRKSRALR